ncbi:MAG: putative response-associated peptidase YedK [Bacteroidota bacterium]|jgi:putative SOS response-associated peptidase YedK
MCYSNSSTSTTEQLAERYKKKIDDASLPGPVFHASGFSFPEWRIITTDESIQAMNWGLIPRWFRGENINDIASKTLNARWETLYEKATFKDLIDVQRCIVPSTGFFEWQHVGKEKIPFFVFPKKDSQFSMAGIYSRWLNPKNGQELCSFSIITVEANELMSEIHNTKKRMPLCLSPEFESTWLTNKIAPKEISILPTDAWDAYRIDPKIVGSNNANCMKVIEEYHSPYGEQQSLF